jgi:hypothetical protein
MALRSSIAGAGPPSSSNANKTKLLWTSCRIVSTAHRSTYGSYRMLGVKCYLHVGFQRFGYLPQIGAFLSAVSQLLTLGGHFLSQQ